MASRKVTFKCDRCGDEEKFWRKQAPIGEMKCLVPLHPHPRLKFPYPICGGIIREVTQASGEVAK